MTSEIILRRNQKIPLDAELSKEIVGEKRVNSGYARTYLEKMVGSVTGFLTGCFVYLFGGWGEPGMVVTPDGGIITTTIDWSGTTDGFFRALFLWLGVPKDQVFDAVIAYTPWILGLCVLIFGGATAFLALVGRGAQ